MPLTDKMSTLVDYVKTLLSDATWMSANGVQQVLYGDQEKIGLTPLICIEPSDKRRTLSGTPRKTEVDFEIYVIVYYGKVQDVQTNRKASDQLAEAIETRLHSDPSCGSLAIHSMVSQLSSGAANKSGSLIRATRLTFTAKSRVFLPMAGV